MSVSFLERSRLERNVIGVVNEKFQHVAELNGLSIPTLNKWSMEVRRSIADVAKFKKIEVLLVEISQRISSDSDSSKHIFADGFFSNNSTIDICIEELKKTLREIDDFK